MWWHYVRFVCCYIAMDRPCAPFPHKHTHTHVELCRRMTAASLRVNAVPERTDKQPTDDITVMCSISATIFNSFSSLETRIRTSGLVGRHTNGWNGIEMHWFIFGMAEFFFFFFSALCALDLFVVRVRSECGRNAATRNEAFDEESVIVIGDRHDVHSKCGWCCFFFPLSSVNRPMSTATRLWQRFFGVLLLFWWLFGGILIKHDVR